MSQQPTVRYYDAQYSQFATQLYAEIRAATFGEDIGQNGWLTSDEHDLFIAWLALTPESRLLDIACGSGRTTLRIAQLIGCCVQGIDMHAQAVAAANAATAQQNLTAQARFDVVDAAQRLPFDDAAFDALICIDAVNHLRDRSAIFHEWARVLEPGGRLVFTDPIVVTGALTNEEIAIRSSIGFFLFVPPDYNERLLAEAGFRIVEVFDRTENMARMAGRWHAARASRAAELRDIEGEETFDGQQRFLEVAARLAAEHRLSRYAFQAVRS
ncbi:MAG TPA: methyltransferase domain-containing protein [Longimicrobiales bacterium]